MSHPKIWGDSCHFGMPVITLYSFQLTVCEKDELDYIHRLGKIGAACKIRSHAS